MCDKLGVKERNEDSFNEIDCPINDSATFESMAICESMKWEKANMARFTA